jgi:hypothetical protein
VAVDRARRTARGERAPSFARLWLALAAVLLAVYSGQELLEALLSRGQHFGTAVPFGEGGWSAIPLALVLGAAAALLLTGASRAVTGAARGARPPRLRPLRGRSRRPVAPVRAPSQVVARHLAGRAPPALRHTT